MWADPENYPYDPSRFLLGCHQDGENSFVPVGLKTERHALTIAGAGAGKGVAVIIPNLLKWQNNALTIDPKGEAAEATAEARERMGQSVHVVDPFGVANVADRFRASYNPLARLDVNDLTVREDIEVIADGIVMRGHDNNSSHWDDGASALIAGVIAYVLLEAPEPEKNLITVREIIADKGRLADAMDDATTMKGCGGLPLEAASAYHAGEGQYFVSNAEKNTRWLSSPAMRNVLSFSSFRLGDLKNSPTSVYLVLPANYLTQHGRFLRLFVRCAIEEMQRQSLDGKLRNKQCLFLLDEFFALGFINEIAVSAGLMRGYGLQLWPILQDLGQLQKLYGNEGAETFFGNADLHQFFGNMDALTLSYIANAIGVKDDADAMKDFVKYEDGVKFWDSENVKTSKRKLAAEINLDAAKLLYADRGRPRLAIDEVARIVGNEDDGHPISHQMICFVPGRRFLKVKTLPFWLMDSHEIRWKASAASSSSAGKKNGNRTTSKAKFASEDKQKTISFLIFCAVFISLSFPLAFFVRALPIDQGNLTFIPIVSLVLAIFITSRRDVIFSKIKEKLGGS